MFYVLTIVSVLAAAMLLIVVIGACRPSQFQVSRSIVISANAQRLFPYINNLKKFQEWNPYKDKDPQAQNEFSGPEEGPGSVFRWSGNNDVGAGSMTISESVPGSRVGVALEFTRPFAGRNAVEFALVPQTDGTRVSWTLNGKHALMPRIVGLFMNMDKMIGGDFEVGLKRLKNLVESSAN